MAHLWPDSQADYEITTNMTLTDFIPDGAQGTVDLVLDVIENPAFGLAQVIANIFMDEAVIREGGNVVPCETVATCEPLVTNEGWQASCEDNGSNGMVCMQRETLDSLEFFGGLISLFHECTADDLSGGTAFSASCNRVGQVVPGNALLDGVFEQINNLIFGAIEEYVPFGGQIVDVFEAIQDGVRNLRNFVIKGEFHVVADPDSNGVMGAANWVEYNEIEITWTGEDAGGNPVTRTRAINLAQQGRDLIEARNITATVALHETERDVYVISLSPFTLKINYGEIILFAIEALVLPAVTGCGDSDGGTCIQSLDELLSWGIADNCTEFLSETIGGLGGIPDAFCGTITAALGAALEAWISTLTIDSDGFFQMFTPANEPCRIGFPGGNAPPFSIANMGSSDTVCIFGAEVRFNEDDAEGEVVNSTWYATIQQ